jgi:hypothetical protein
MSPVDLAMKRREADRRELERAKAVEDWGAALDVILANQHEGEGHLLRLVAEQVATREEVSKLGRAWADANEKLGAVLERPPVPSYRPSLASANHLDAQAIGQTIEGVYAELRGTDIALAQQIENIKAQVGEAPDVTKGRKGSGISEIVHRLDSKATVAKLAVLVTLAGAAGANLAELVKWLVHLKG